MDELKQTCEDLEIELAKIGIKCIGSFYFFFKTFWPEFSGENMVDNWHIKLICDTLQKYGEKIARGEELRKTIVINVPPGSSKSSICTVAFPLWMWLIKPSCTTVNIAFSADLSKDHQALSKDIPDSDRWRSIFDNILTAKWGKPLKIDVCNKNMVQNNFMGKRFNTSVGGSITGRHCDIIIEDDPLNPEQAFSQAERETAIRFHDKTISTRKKNDNCYLNIIIAQRLHEMDVCGHVLQKNLDITHICLPGEITPSTLVEPEYAREFYTDGILNPIRKGRKVLEDLKESMGVDAYTTQVLQLPFDLQAQDITPDMFQYIEPGNVRDDITWDVFVDGAFTEKTENDPTGIDIVAKVNGELWVKNSYDVRMKLPDLLKFIKELGYGKFDENGRMINPPQFDAKNSRIFIEPKASGHPLADMIEVDTDFNFVRIGEHHKGEAKIVNAGKKARHELIKPRAESHKIRVVKGGWNEGFINQIVGFPRAAHDEHVDTIGYAVYHYYHKENSFINERTLNVIENNLIDSFNVDITSQKVTARNGITNTLEVGYKENDSGDVRMFDYPNAHYRNRYICVVVMKSEAERGGKTCIMVYDRVDKVVVAMHENEVINTRKVAYKALELSYLYDHARLVVAVKRGNGTTQNEENDLSHMIIQEIRKIGYDNIYLRLKQNDITKKRETEYGFEVSRSTSREIYVNLKEMAETFKLKEMPSEVYKDICLLERKPETGEVDGRDGLEINCGLAYAIALKIDIEWSEDAVIKRVKDRWAS